MSGCLDICIQRTDCSRSHKAISESSYCWNVMNLQFTCMTPLRDGNLDVQLGCGIQREGTGGNGRGTTILPRVSRSMAIPLACVADRVDVNWPRTNRHAHDDSGRQQNNFE